jgi:hypothetical protein
MRTLAKALFPIVFFLVASVALADEKDEKTGLAVGKNLPGAFHPYNLSGGHKDHLHDLVGAHGLYPGVLVFVRKDAPSAAHTDLIKKLDAAESADPKARLGLFVIVVDDQLDGDKADDRRQELAAKWAPAEMGQHEATVFGLASSKDLAAYHLGDQAEVTVVLYNKLAVKALSTFAKDSLTDKDIDAIVAAVAEQLGSKKK